MINDTLIKFISDTFLIRDCFIEKLSFIYSKGLSIQMEFKTAHGERRQIRFNGIKEYSFFNNNFEEGENLISHYKLFKQQEYYYFSFDPYTENAVVETDDNDYLIFSDFELIE